MKQNIFFKIRTKVNKKNQRTFCHFQVKKALSVLDLHLLDVRLIQLFASKPEDLLNMDRRMAKVKKIVSFRIMLC